MPSQTATPHTLRVSDLAQSGPVPFDVTPSAAELAQWSNDLALLDLRKVRFSGRLSPIGKSDWQLAGSLGATVMQPCVVSLDPVRTRIEEPVERMFVLGYEMLDAPEAEMPDEDHIEPLGPEIDLGRILFEAISLALPLYPRAAEVDAPVTIRVTEPGKEAMTDEQAKPFAGLAALKDKLPPSSDA